MIRTRHCLSGELFAELAAGRGGSRAVSQLAAAEYSKHMLLLLGVLTTAQDREQYSLAREGFDLLAEAWRADSDAAEAVVRHPSVGVWARRTMVASGGGAALPGAEPAGLRAVAAAAAIRAGLAADIEVAVSDGRVMLPSLGMVVVGGLSVRVRSGGGQVSAGPVEIPDDPHQDAPGWLGLRRVRTGALDVLIDNLDPFRMPDAPDLAPRQSTVREWQDALSAAWLVLERVHPVVAAEIAAAVSVIVPRVAPAAGVVSTSSPEAFGAIAMSLPPDALTCAETITHEIQHLKLGAVLDVVTLTMPDDGRRYYAPWRDDPRPLAGLLQGTYAYLGVSAFWRRQRQLGTDQDESEHARPRRADTEYARWRVAAAQVTATLLGSGRLTPDGREFVDVMARTLESWQQEPVQPHAQDRARRVAESHLARWQAAHGDVPGMS
jgi:HEXXH motif-containing protein